MDSRRESPGPGQPETGPADGPATGPAGDPRVDAAIARLADLDGLDLAGHPEVLREVHGRLREILGELGDAAGPAEPGHGTPLPDRRSPA